MLISRYAFSPMFHIICNWLIQENRHFNFYAYTALMLLVSLFCCIVACSARIAGDRLTDRPTNNCKPRCAWDIFCYISLRHWKPFCTMKQNWRFLWSAHTNYYVWTQQLCLGPDTSLCSASSHGVTLSWCSSFWVLVAGHVCWSVNQERMNIEEDTYTLTSMSEQQLNCQCAVHRSCTLWH